MSKLPQPEPAAVEHGARVAEHLVRMLDQAGGAIPFVDYMDTVLYAPGLGYYSAGSHKLGEGGDFVTAPEISPLFGRCLARQYAQLHAQGLDQILEIGAGSGRMAADLLVEAATQGFLPERYSILEVSADLRARQRDTLEALAPGLLDRIEWLDRLPETFEGFVLANEVLDALPVHRFQRTEEGVLEATVVRDGTRFGWSTRLADALLADAVANIEQDLGQRLPVGFVSDVALRTHAWMSSLAAMLQRGAILLIDYGMTRSEYYAPERNTGTLRCHYRQHAHDDPFVWPGLQDITAQVDFTAVAEAGVSGGLELAGYTTQAHLLLGCGLERLLAEPLTDERAGWVRSQQAQKLVLPGEMGERFKAIGFTRDMDIELAAFSVRDLRDRL